MASSYYHISTRELRIGTTLTQGVYGEKVQRPDFIEKMYHKHLVENIFEQLRLTQKPKAPSRLNCVYLFDEWTTAQMYFAFSYRYNAYVYEVDIVSGTPFRAEMDLLKCENQPFGVIKEQAELYWTGQKHTGSMTTEVLLDGKAVVKNLLLQPSVIGSL